MALMHYVPRRGPRTIYCSSTGYGEVVICGRSNGEASREKQLYYVAVDWDVPQGQDIYWNLTYWHPLHPLVVYWHPLHEGALLHGSFERYGESPRAEI